LRRRPGGCRRLSIVTVRKKASGALLEPLGKAMETLVSLIKAVHK
jgi:hypothetical protein